MRSILCECKDGNFDYVFSSQNEERNDFKVGQKEVAIKVVACYLARQHSDVLVKLFSKKGQSSFSPAMCVSGCVLQIGSMVSCLKVNNRVVASIPLDSQPHGRADVCVVNEIYVVDLAADVDDRQAVLLMSEGVKAYTALHYLAALKANDRLVLCDASSSFGCLLLQLAKLWKANVTAIVSKKADKNFLQSLSHPPDCIVDMESHAEAGATNLVSMLMDATGQLGADIIVDNGVRLFSSEKDSLAGKDDLSSWKPLKQEIISSLSVGGRWVTSNPLLQIDPVDSMQLYLKQASVGYLFDQAWTLSSCKLGKWICIVKDLLGKVQAGSIQHPACAPQPVAFSDLKKLEVSKADAIICMEI
ncbi:hypothetical protein HELRODRAFT_189358 [Helobdella robusta]|uniref:Enoyl reductase (ER) domain-containing protein n=1 Tax=Helobdella robusta TaxID=6412 RepID=T1FR00_HELRO|nr:hypothetical protein HELRODRAFT_189358 [Helobdella robusta]ESN94151.1 hypothetical protein HELRODRAFT_189358 [Helobdella robusta]